MQHPISSLSLGPRGWVQEANFTVAAALFGAAAAGLRQATGDVVEPSLVAAAGVGLALAAGYATDPVGDYPPGESSEPTRTGAIHNLSALPVFFGLPVAQVVSAVRSDQPTWAAYSTVSAVTMLGSVVAAAAGFGGNPRWVPYGGAFQRVAVVSGLGWISATCRRTLAAAPVSPAR